MSAVGQALSIPVTNSMEQSFFEKLIVAQPVKKFPAFYGTIRFITILTRASN
jgi:hypothetical protein